MNRKDTFCKEERLYHKKDFDALFKQSMSYVIQPFKFYWKKADFEGKYPIKFAISVPKKNFKTAVARNKIKRQVKEIYRKNKNGLYTQLETSGGKLLVLATYISNSRVPFKELELKIKLAFERLIKEYEKNS